jgi:hypothetical protein
MSQQIINISTPDDGLGDVLRNGFNKTNQNFTELYNGKVDKITGKGLSKNDFTDTDKAKLDGIEAGAQVNVQADAAETDPLSPSYIQNFPPSLYSAFGYFHISDLATQTTPLAFLAATPLQLTNDGRGAFTNYEQAPYGVSDIWNTSTNKFEFAKLSVGDGVLFRADLSISTTSVNQNLQLYIKFGIGTPSEYDLLIDSWNEKSVITFKHFLKDVSFSIDNEDWRTAPAKIYILSDDDGSVKVNGWYIPIIRKSLNIIDFNSDPLKLNKDTTAGVERVYTINADGSQGTKATGDFKDVLEFTNLAAFPVTGESSKIYVDLDSNSQYRWSGSAYVQIGGTTKKTENLFFQDAVGSTVRTITADQKNMHQSRILANASPYGVLGLTLGNGIKEVGGVINLSNFSDYAVAQITGDYLGKVKKIVFTYARNVNESSADTNVMIRVMGETKYLTDMQLIAEHNLVSTTFLSYAENKVEIPVLTHLPLSAFSNIKWCIRSNNATEQKFGIIKINVIVEEI